MRNFSSDIGLPLLKYPKVIPCTKFEHLFLSYAADKQTDKQTKQTDGPQRPTHADRPSVGNKTFV